MVFGDVMLDQYWWGKVDRISPEAPVPIVSFDRKSLVAGGAANVASNIAGLGATPILVGVIGNDEEGDLLSSQLVKLDISVEHLVKAESRPTIIKTRIIANNQQIVRLDRETREDIDANLANLVEKRLSALIEYADIVLISDYAKGAVTVEIAKWLIAETRKNGKLILVDPKGKDYSKYKNASVLTPNQKEALDAAGFDDSEDAVRASGEKLLTEFSFDNLLITRGENGMALFSKDTEIRYLETVARNVFDVTGAGDTVISTLAVALGAGKTFFEACKLANIAAGIVVEKLGTSAISRGDLDRAVSLL